MQEGYNIKDLEVGMSDSMSKTVTEADIVLYAGITGDFNPVHVNEEYAKTTVFKGRIAHGMVSAGFISAVLAMKLPGPGSIYLGQTLQFKAPVRIGDTVTTTVTITEIKLEKKIVIFETTCTIKGEVVVTGNSTMMKP